MKFGRAGIGLGKIYCEWELQGHYFLMVFILGLLFFYSVKEISKYITISREPDQNGETGEVGEEIGQVSHLTLAEGLFFVCFCFLVGLFFGGSIIKIGIKFETQPH